MSIHCEIDHLSHCRVNPESFSPPTDKNSDVTTHRNPSGGAIMIAHYPSKNAAAAARHEPLWDSRNAV